MALSISLENSTFTLNSTVISEWSEDTDALTIPEITIAAVKRGADGRMIGTSTGDKGGAVGIKLLANSESVKFLSSLANQQKNGASIVYNAKLLNHNTGASCDFTNGILITYQPFPQLGKGEIGSMAYTIEFESLQGTFETATFT